MWEVNFGWLDTIIGNCAYCNRTSFSITGLQPEEFDVSYARYLYKSSFTSMIVSFFSGKPIGYEIEIFASLKSRYKELHTSILINGKTYSNVGVYETTGLIGDPRLPRIIYYARNIGIVRKELWNDQV